MSDAAKRIKIPGHIGYERVEGDFVLVNLRSGTFLGLDTVASLIWQVFTAGGTVNDATREVLARYDVTEERARHDIEDLLRELAGRDVIEIVENEL